MARDALQLVITRRLFVPRELVFDVWTQPEHLSFWYAPGSDFERCAEADVERGGSYSLWWKDLHGHMVRQSGEYEVVEPPEKLVFSARYDSDSGPAFATRITVMFHDLGDATRIEVCTDPCPESFRQGLQDHWMRMLDQLEIYFTSI